MAVVMLGDQVLSLQECVGSTQHVVCGRLRFTGESEKCAQSRTAIALKAVKRMGMIHSEDPHGKVIVRNRIELADWLAVHSSAG